MLGKALIAGVITFAIIGTSGQMFTPKPVLFYNPSYSAPVGWYKLRVNEPIVSGAQVAAYAPQWARKMADERGYLPYDYPLIKTVWAVHGDEVCYNNGSSLGRMFWDAICPKSRAVMFLKLANILSYRQMCRRGLIAAILALSAVIISLALSNIWENHRIRKSLKG